MTRHVLFFCIAGRAHLRPALVIVAGVVRRGHRVTVVVPPEFAGPAERAGAGVIPYASTWPDAGQRDPQSEIPADAVAWEPLLFLREGRAAVTAAREALGDRRPDLIVYDATLGHAARVLAADWRVPAVQVHTTFAANTHFSPIASVGHLRGHPALAEYRRATADLLRRFELDDLELPEFAVHPERLSIVLLSRGFQVAGDTFDDSHVFVGAVLDPLSAARAEASGRRPPPGESRAEESSADEEPDGERPVLLVDLDGFRYAGRDLPAECARAFAGTPWRVVIGVGDPGEVPDPPPNVELCPQPVGPAILARAAALVSRAGMGSTMRALYFGVPVVAVPCTPQQETVGRRIEELSLGRCLTRAAVTAGRLRAAVLEVATDSRIAQGVAAMRDDVRRGGGTGTAVDAILAHMDG